MELDPKDLQEFLNGAKSKLDSGDSPSSEEIETEQEDQQGDGLDTEDMLELKDKDDDFIDADTDEEPDEEEPEVETEDEEDEEEAPKDIKATPEEQSKDKDNPANKAFAKLNRRIKELETELNTKDMTVKEINEKFAKLAKQSGFEGIETADQYFQALNEQSSLKKYRQTNDPNVLLKLAEERVMQKLQPVMSKTQETAKQVGQNKFEQELQQHITDLNETYGTDVKSADDIVKLPNADKIIKRMGKGDTLSDAYLLANRDLIFEQQSRKSRQSAVNTAKGFAHQDTGSRTDKISDDGLSQAEINQNLPTWQMLYPDKNRSQVIKMMKAARKRGDM